MKNGEAYAGQYYGGSLFDGFVADSLSALCINNGVVGYWKEGTIASFSANGYDEFNTLDKTSGVYYTTAPGQVEGWCKELPFALCVFVKRAKSSAITQACIPLHSRQTKY